MSNQRKQFVYIHFVRCSLLHKVNMFCACAYSHRKHVLSLQTNSYEIFKHIRYWCADRGKWTQSETSLQHKIASSFLLHMCKRYTYTQIYVRSGNVLTQNMRKCVWRVSFLSLDPQQLSEILWNTMCIGLSHTNNYVCTNCIYVESRKEIDLCAKFNVYETRLWHIFDYFVHMNIELYLAWKFTRLQVHVLKTHEKPCLFLKIDLHW